MMPELKKLERPCTWVDVLHTHPCPCDSIRACRVPFRERLAGCLLFLVVFFFVVGIRVMESP